MSEASAGLDDADAGLGGSRTCPEQADAGLGQAEAGLGQAGTRLEHAEAGLGQAGTGLGRAEAGLGQAEAGLGQAEARLGHPRLHLRRTTSTNDRARQLAIAGAPHGTAVTAAEQSAGRGRQGRSWLAPPDSALLCSLILRDPPPLLSLIAGVAVCDVVSDYLIAEHAQRAPGERACVKWPNDVVLGAGLAKLAGILVEGRPQEGWAVLGIGLNVAVRIAELPAELRAPSRGSSTTEGGRAGAASLKLAPSAIEPIFQRLLATLDERLSQPIGDVLGAWRARDALRGRDVAWGMYGRRDSARGSDGTRDSARDSDGARDLRDPEDTDGPQDRGGRGRAEGIDDEGRLLVRLDGGATTALSAGEVHLESLG